MKALEQFIKEISTSKTSDYMLYVRRLKVLLCLVLTTVVV